MAVRMKDIAEALGVSVVTVSKVIHNHNDISDATKERVLARVKELNYRPNLTARGLSTGHNYMVGLIVPDLVHAFFAELANGLSSVLRKHGYGLVLSSSKEDPDLERREIEEMLARNVDVLLVASCQQNSDNFVRMKKQTTTPCVLIDRKFDGYRANFVGNDDQLIGDLGTTHLIELGRRRIAHIGGPQVSTSLARIEGYRRALARHRIQVPPEYLITRTLGDVAGHVTGFQSMQALLRLQPRPDAVFCFNDPAAVGAMQAILEAGLRIPQDIAIVGCGNLPYSEYLRVPLTSVDQSSYELGEEAAKLALKVRHSKKALRPKSILIAPKLVVRQSTVIAA
jgi:LacI family transcriptional regulator